MLLTRFNNISLFAVTVSFLIALSKTLFSDSVKDLERLKLENIEKLCLNSLEWYDRHPGYKGEFRRVLEYCKNYAKDVSPEGFMVNPILSDFG